jgi:hypothetical protein
MEVTQEIILSEPYLVSDWAEDVDWGMCLSYKNQQPTWDELLSWQEQDAGSQAIDGCLIERIGERTCREHGCPNWLVVTGFL